MKHIFHFLQNKFVIASLVFLMWLLFFDNNDFITQFRLNRKLIEMKDDKEYYLHEIAKNRSDLHDLMTNPENLEKFAREKYLMKKENEEIFVIVKEE